MKNSRLSPPSSVIDSLLELVDRLRGQEGCPWDRQQTPRSMAYYLLEEVYELIDAIENNHPDNVCEELGDILFHIYFITRLFQEEDHFNMEDVVAGNIEKMVRRHPHVFGEKTIDTPDEVKAQWHQIKMKEKNHARSQSLIDSVPKRLPALMRSLKISDRVAKTGFEWNDISDAFDKVEEELSELKSALKDSGRMKNGHDSAAMEFGDVLLTLVNVARLAKIHPETALSDSTQKFERRFKQMEKIVSAQDRTLPSLSYDEMVLYWEQAKQKINSDRSQT